MVDRTAELLAMYGRLLFCPHRSAAFKQWQKVVFELFGSFVVPIFLVPAGGRAGYFVVIVHRAIRKT